jgi:recombination protein U
MPRYRGSHANRGKLLERDIDVAAKYYAFQKKASIIQMPVPVKIKRRQQNGDVLGVMQTSTVDFYGTIEGGRAIHFDAKETTLKSFPMANVHSHQVKHLETEHNLGAISFILVSFVNENEYYIIPFSVFKQYWDHAQSLGKGERGKSIPIKDCRERDDIIRLQTTGGYLNIVEAIKEYWE